MFFKDKWFGQYNYNKQKNMERYGQPDAPAYDLTKITVPVALYHAENDWLSSMEVKKNKIVPASRGLLLITK